jgi:hypothetical protein
VFLISEFVVHEENAPTPAVATVDKTPVLTKSRREKLIFISLQLLIFKGIRCQPDKTILADNSLIMIHLPVNRDKLCDKIL